MQLASFNDISTYHSHIFLSSHFNDVVYSCSGTLSLQVNQGQTPLVLTIFGGIPSPNLTLSPLAQKIHAAMGGDSTNASSVTEIRRREDSAALDYLQVDYLWLDYPEAIYRGTPANYINDKQLMGGEVHPTDFWISRQLTQDLLTLQEKLSSNATWYVPLGVGQHVDLQILRCAVPRLIGNGADIYFYEEFPQVLQKGSLAASIQYFKEEFDLALNPIFIKISETLVQRLIASEMYASQIGQFSDREAMIETIQHYVGSICYEEVGYFERYWIARGV